jgi:hypothetical protein
LAEDRKSPVLQIAFAVALAALGVATAEIAMRYRNWPPSVVSGWQTTAASGPVNQLGWRGQPWQPHRQADFVVVVTGRFECAECPPDETLDVMLERALRRYNPNARVVTLGSSGYSQDQEFLALHEYFAHERADLVVTWASIADDVPANTFRGVRTGSGSIRSKPTFALQDNDIRGPTEMIGQPLYGFKISALLWPMFIDLDRDWGRLLPKPDPGATDAPSTIAARRQVDDALEEQRSPWAIWLTPRPARVKYGIALTSALLRHMRELTTLRGARFTVLLTPPEPHAESPVALEHAGHWFVADPAARDAAVAEVTEGLDMITLPLMDSRPDSPEAGQQVMTQLADVLSQHNLLVSAALARPRR